jgi:hypothetical protein
MKKHIEFKGKVVSGWIKHSELAIPGKSKLPSAPSDWPETLCPGSLNIEISVNDLPKELDNLGPGMLIKKLDNGILKPVLIIKQEDIINNTIGPNGPVKGRGDAQVWRAKLLVEKSKNMHDCWVLRRLDSGMTKHLELASTEHLRQALNLLDGDKVSVLLEGGIEDDCKK